MLLASDSITIGEKWTTVLPSEIDVDFFTVCAQLCVWEHKCCKNMPAKVLACTNVCFRHFAVTEMPCLSSHFGP